jgi:putative DNA primase/helicase
VGKINHALQSAALLASDVRHPAWLGEDCPVEDVRQLIACKNGLLHFPSGKLFNHDPRFWSHNVLPFEYDPAAQCQRWIQFLEEILPGDTKAHETTQEIFGLCLTDETRFQKSFLFYGPKRSGKGTIGRVLRQLVGVDNYVGPTLAGFVKQFGMQSWIGKKVSVFSDARLGHANVMATERFLSITGEDPLDIDRKYLPAWTGILSTRIIVLTNELPKFEDDSGALPSRFIVVQLRESFFGREDIDLTEKLVAELPGILNWAREGWNRLAKRRQFEQPESGREAAESLRIIGSKISAFVEELCELGPQYEIGITELHQAFSKYLALHNLRTSLTVHHFSGQLKAAYSSIETERPRSDDPKRPRNFIGIRLKQPAAAQPALKTVKSTPEPILDEPVSNVVRMLPARR